MGLLLVALGVIALLAVAAFVVLGSKGSSGGSKQPEDAVRALADAIDAEDPIAAVAAMDPDEVKALGEVYTSVESRARELGYAPKEKALGGVDVTVTGLTLKTTPLDGTTARVTITGGSIGYTVTESALGGRLKAVLDQWRARDGDKATGTESGRLDATKLLIGDAPVKDVMVVKRGGGWFVSPTYTAAEYLTQAYDLPAGAFRDDLAPTKATAATPEAAAEALARAVSANDVDTAVTQLSGPELLAVQSYKAAIRALLDQHEGLKGAKAAISAVKFSSEEIDGDRAQVNLDSVSGTATWTSDQEPQSAPFTWNGTCLEVTGSDHAFRNCITDDTKRFGLTKVFVVAVEEDGKWRVSPIETALRYVTTIAPELDDNLIALFLNVPEAVAPTGVAAIGTTTDVKLNDAGFAVYTLPVKADDAFSIHTEDLPDDESSGFYLVKPNGETEYPSQDEVVEAEDAGTWKLVVGREHLLAGTVKVTIGSVLQRNITIDMPETGAIEKAGQIVRYKLNPGSATKVAIELDNEDLSWALLDQYDAEVDASADGTYPLDESDTYTIQVTSKGGTTGDYKLSVTAPVEFVLGNGKTTTASGNIAQPDTVLNIDLQVTGGAKVLATLSTKVSSMDVTLTVIDPDGTRTPYNTAGPGKDEVVSFFPKTDTTFTIEITASGGTGDVSLSVVPDD